MLGTSFSYQGEPDTGQLDDNQMRTRLCSAFIVAVRGQCSGYYLIPVSGLLTGVAMKLRDSNGWPVETVKGRCVQNFLRLLFRTDWIKTWKLRNRRVEISNLTIPLEDIKEAMRTGYKDLVVTEEVSGEKGTLGDAVVSIKATYKDHICMNTGEKLGECACNRCKE